MLGFIFRCLYVIFMYLLGAASIGFAVEAFKKRRYFWFGMYIMAAILETMLIAGQLFNCNA